MKSSTRFIFLKSPLICAKIYDGPESSHVIGLRLKWYMKDVCDSHDVSRHLFDAVFVHSINCWLCSVLILKCFFLLEYQLMFRSSFYATCCLNLVNLLQCSLLHIITSSRLYSKWEVYKVSNHLRWVCDYFWQTIFRVKVKKTMLTFKLSRSILILKKSKSGIISILR